MTDDLPAESWLHVRVLDGETPKAVRLRLWLKDGLRRHGIQAVRITGEVPRTEAIGGETRAGAMCGHADQGTE